jgi:hypothetical protein
MSHIFEGPVRISTTDKDNQPLVIKNGKRAGQPFCKVSFKVGEEWVNTVDFSNDAAGYDGQVCKVAYSEKVDEFGDPVLYNGKPQWNLEAIKPSVAAPATQSASPASSAAPRDDSHQESIQRQTTAKCAAEIVAAICASSDDNCANVETSDFDRWFDHILARITGDPVAEAKAKLDAVEEDEDDIPF